MRNVPITVEDRFREWAAKAPGINFGNLDYALKDHNSVAWEALQAFKAGVKAGKAMRNKPAPSRR